MSVQTPTLFDLAPVFRGATYSKPQDEKRLGSQLERVFSILQDGKWHTLRSLAKRVQGSEAGVSARLRDLRSAEYGAHTIKSSRVTSGLWKYRMVI